MPELLGYSRYLKEDEDILVLSRQPLFARTFFWDEFSIKFSIYLTLSGNFWTLAWCGLLSKQPLFAPFFLTNLLLSSRSTQLILEISGLWPGVVYSSSRPKYGLGRSRIKKTTKTYETTIITNEKNIGNDNNFNTKKNDNKISINDKN